MKFYLYLEKIGHLFRFLMDLLVGRMIRMANKRCVALSEEEYKQSIDLLRNGFELNEKIVKPNPRIATICVLQSVLGLRLSDILNLTVDSIIRDSDRFRLDIVEQKTGKQRTFTVPTEIYTYIVKYALDNGINKNKKLFNISKRQVSRHLNKVFAKMGLNIDKYGSHSYRKMFATQAYIESDYDVELVRVLLQHSNLSITQRYLNVSSKKVEAALEKTVKNLI